MAGINKTSLDHCKGGSALTEKSYNEKSRPMEQCTFKNVNYCLNTNIYSYLEPSSGKSFNLNLNVVHFFPTPVLIRHL
jgi:hypothetical protein